MAEIALKEAPGGLPDCYQCPYCSAMYPTFVIENGEPRLDQEADPPRICRRCGSPMDLAQAQKFQDDMAAQIAVPNSPLKRRSVKR